MSFEFKITEELSIIPVTAAELLSIARSYQHFVKSPESLLLFNAIIYEISKSYGVVVDILSPFLELDNEDRFSQQFDEQFRQFKESYLFDISKPRRFCDNVYDDYNTLLQSKEAKSKFPMLKRLFTRLDVIYDKWITNDNLLAMSIDNCVKLYNRHLTDIAELKKRDPEDAYLIHQAANDVFIDFVTLIHTLKKQLQQLSAPAPVIVSKTQQYL